MDLAHALEVFPDLNTQRTVEIFVEYVKERPILRWQAEKRMLEKLDRSEFLLDVRPLLTAEERGRFDQAAGALAFSRVFEAFITKIPGKIWKTTPELLKKHDLNIKGYPN